MKNKNGFGLFEIVISLAIFSIFGIAFLSWTRSYSKMSQNIDQKMNLVGANKVITEQLDCCRTYSDYFGPAYELLIPLADAKFLTIPIPLKNSRGEELVNYTRPWEVEGRPGGIGLNIFYNDSRVAKTYIERDTSTKSDRKLKSGEEENLKCQYNINHCAVGTSATSTSGPGGGGTTGGSTGGSTGGTTGGSTGGSAGGGTVGTGSSSGSSSGATSGFRMTTSTSGSCEARYGCCRTASGFCVFTGWGDNCSGSAGCIEEVPMGSCGSGGGGRTLRSIMIRLCDVALDAENQANQPER